MLAAHGRSRHGARRGRGLSGDVARLVPVSRVGQHSRPVVLICCTRLTTANHRLSLRSLPPPGSVWNARRPARRLGLLAGPSWQAWPRRRPPTAPPPSHLRNWLRFVKRLPATFPTQRRIASYGELASFRQISASGTALMPCPARAPGNPCGILESEEIRRNPSRPFSEQAKAGPG